MGTYLVAVQPTVSWLSAKGLTLAEIATRVGVSYMTVWKWSRGQRAMKAYAKLLDGLVAEVEGEAGAAWRPTARAGRA